MSKTIKELQVKEVKADDYGDTHWKYYSELFIDGKLIWTDYHHDRPTIKEVIESIKEK